MISRMAFEQAFDINYTFLNMHFEVDVKWLYMYEIGDARILLLIIY